MEQDKGKLFQLFATMNNAKNQNQNGIGLGLVISKAIVETYNGDIRFVSEHGIGTVFTFSFEIKQEGLDHLDKALEPENKGEISLIEDSDEEDHDPTGLYNKEKLLGQQFSNE
jgi:hypothetical protein